MSNDNIKEKPVTLATLRGLCPKRATLCNLVTEQEVNKAVIRLFVSEKHSSIRTMHVDHIITLFALCHKFFKYLHLKM